MTELLANFKIKAIHLFIGSLVLLAATFFGHKDTSTQIFVETFNSSDITDLSNQSGSMLINSLKGFSAGKYVKFNYSTNFKEQIRITKSGKGQNFIALYPIGAANPIIAQDTLIVGTVQLTDIEIQANPTNQAAYFQVIQSGGTVPSTAPADIEMLQFYKKLPEYFSKYHNLAIDSSVMLKTVHFSPSGQGPLLKNYITDESSNTMLFICLALLAISFINLLISVMQS